MTVAGGLAAPGAAAWPSGLGRDAARDLTGAGVGVVLCGFAVDRVAGFGVGYVVEATIAFAACALLIWRRLPRSHPYSRLGAANRITLARLGVASLLAAIIGRTGDHRDAVAWGIVVIATASALLDLVDGRLARRSGLASNFGARFDMETDAWFTLVLCGLIVWFGKTGAWVLAAGLMRYVFVAASRVWPWLAAPLGESTRRKAVCVAQITMLITCLGPIVSRDTASGLAAVSLLMVSWSFAVDIRALALARPPEPTST